MQLNPISVVLVLVTLCPWAGAADTVYLADIEAFEPRTAVSDEPSYGQWYLRRVKWTEHAEALLNLAGTPDVPDLTCSPNLQGRYNIYVGCRQVDRPTIFQTRVGDDELWYTIDPGLATEKRHFNKEILFAPNVDMAGKTLTLHAVSELVYFYYFKFVRADADVGAHVDPAHVTRTPRTGGSTEVAERIKSGYFVERVHVDLAPMPVLSDTQRQVGFVVFNRHYLRLTFPNTVPRADQLTDRLAVFAAPGEFEPVSFAVRALRDLTGFTVSVTPLGSADGAVIPASAADIRSVRCLRRRSTSYHGKGEFMNVPVLLESRPSVDLAAGETKQFWLTVCVPGETVPGTYRGRVTVGTREREVRLQLALEVLPIRLPAAPPGYALGMYDLWPRGVTPLDDRFRDMRDHGMTTVGWCGDSGAELILRDGTAVAKLQGSRLARVLDAHGRFLTQPLLWLMGGELDSWSMKNAKSDADYASLYGQIIRQILKYCHDRSLPGIIFQPADECPSVVTNFPAALRQLKVLKAIGARTEMDHMGFRYRKRPDVDAMAQEAMPLTDVLTMRFSTRTIWYDETWAELVRLSTETGKVLWTYNINNGLCFPEPTSNRFCTGVFFHTFGKGCTGEFMWAYQSPCKALYEDLDGQATDYLWRYPAWVKDAEVGGPTVMWECLREGVDDLRYIEALSAMIQARQTAAPVAAKQAQATLDEVLGGIRIEELRRADCRYIESEWETSFILPDGRLACSGEFRVPNGWRAEDYDRARRDIANAIVALQSSGR